MTGEIMDEKFDPTKIKGISAETIVMPIAAIILIMHIMVVFLIVQINGESGRMSRAMSEAGVQKETATSLIAGASLLSETSSGFVFMPKTDTGAVNTMPLGAFAEELANPRRGSQTVEKFKAMDVGPETLATLEDAAKSADYMYDSQLRAIALVGTVYEIPDTEPFNTIPKYELTAKEKNMTEEERLALARSLLLSSEYSLNKRNLSEKVNLCVGIIEQDSGKTASESGRKLAIYRMLMWVITLLIIAILVLAFFWIYSKIISPLKKIATQIPIGEELDENKGAREVRLVSAAYNSASRRRDALDEILRTAAEQDQLTRLPNRYRYEQYKLDVEGSETSAAVLLFDIDYLKLTNDKYGHRAGDRLIRDTAESILSAFGTREGDNCFRMGGDEFAAIVTDCTRESVDDMIAQFKDEQKARRISVSMGCAYTDDLSTTAVKKLMDEADQRMYEYKKENHKQIDVTQEEDTGKGE